MDINMQSPMPAPEHDDEGKMAKADLYKSAKYSLKLFKMMEDDAQLEGWVQAKITKAADYLASVYHYLEYEMKFTEYGRAIEDSEMYTESEKRILKNKLLEAKEKVKDLKKAQAEKLKAKEKKKVDESEDDRGGDDDTNSDFNKIKTSSGHTRHSRKSSRAKADHELHGDVPVTSLHPDHDERAAKFLAKQVRGNKVSPMDQLTKRKGMSDLDEAKAKKAKKDYDGDGKVETGKDEVIGSRRKAAGLPFKEGAKPDFLDMDKDGNKKEPMKKAVASKKVKEAADKKCNHTAKGKSCPVHGMKECSGMMAERNGRLSELGVRLSQPKANYGDLTGSKEYNDQANVNASAAEYRALIKQTQQEIEKLKANPRSNPAEIKYLEDQIKGLEKERTHNFIPRSQDDASNSLRKQAIANNDLTLGQWLQKATQYFKGKVTGQPQPGVSYDRYDTSKQGRTGWTTPTPYNPAMESAKPSAGMSKGEKSAVAKKARAGKDIGKPGKSFDKVAKSAGGGEKGTKIAAAAMWKNQAK